MENLRIREVCADNLEEEFELIREILDDYPYIAMHTVSSPGEVVRPFAVRENIADFNYQTLRAEVDTRKLIQLGLTFSDESGCLPVCHSDNYCVWKFNFREDVYVQDSIELLKQNGIDFRKNEERGIDSTRFAELLMSSGVVMNESLHWITFHGGDDFGYILKALTGQNLPRTAADFLKSLSFYIPTLYDIKYLMKFCNLHDGGLNELAEILDVERLGSCHQAGSDSLFKSRVFCKLKEKFFSGDTKRYAGVLYGLGSINDGES